MNCKPGDLAILIKSVAGNEGKIVRCIRTVERGGLFGFGTRWVTDPVLIGVGDIAWYPLDKYLRPLRGAEDVSYLPLTIEEN